MIENIRKTQTKIRDLRNRIELDKAKRKTKTEIIIETSVENEAPAAQDEE